ARSTGRARLIPLVPTAIKLLVWMRQRRQASVVGLLERLLRNGPMKAVEVARFMGHYGCSDRAVARARKTLGVVKERIGGTGPKGYYVYRLPDGYQLAPDPAEADYVFMTCLGNPLNKSNLGNWLGRIRKRSGLLGANLYGLRHRFFSQGIKNKA